MLEGRLVAFRKGSGLARNSGLDRLHCSPAHLQEHPASRFLEAPYGLLPVTKNSARPNVLSRHRLRLSHRSSDDADAQCGDIIGLVRSGNSKPGRCVDWWARPIPAVCNGCQVIRLPRKPHRCHPICGIGGAWLASAATFTIYSASGSPTRVWRRLSRVQAERAYTRPIGPAVPIVITPNIFLL